VVEHATGNRIGTLDYFRFFPRREDLFLTPRIARFPMAEAERRILSRFVSWQREVRPHPHDQQVGMHFVEPRDGSIVPGSPQFCLLFWINHVRSLLGSSIAGARWTLPAATLRGQVYASFFASRLTTSTHAFTSSVGSSSFDSYSMLRLP